MPDSEPKGKGFYFFHVYHENGPIQDTSDRKGLWDIIGLPVTGVIIAGILSLAGYLVTAVYTKGNNERTIAAANIRARENIAATQIQAVSSLAKEISEKVNWEKKNIKEFSAYAASLVVYGPYAVPILTNLLLHLSDQEMIEIVRRNLLQIALLHDGRKEVSEAVALLLTDQWNKYEFLVQLAAIRVLRETDPALAKEVMRTYDPTKRVKDWEHLSTNPKDCMAFLSAVEGLTRRFSKDCKLSNTLSASF